MKLIGPQEVSAVASGFLPVVFAGAASASVDQGDGITALQLATGILVFALYAGNHFKDRIRAFLRKALSRG